jgi:thioredoxin-like negative regulator of GroEL
MTQLTLYGRELCHLCYEMERAVQACCRDRPFELTVVDIDSDPELVARFGDSIPVLMAGDSVICRSFWDRAAFDALFQKMQ